MGSGSGRAADSPGSDRLGISCCSFFSFSCNTSGDALQVDVEVPAEQIAVLDTLTRRSDERTVISSHLAALTTFRDLNRSTSKPGQRA
jgi:hypothetical protein